jgi:hypothetical protein
MVALADHSRAATSVDVAARGGHDKAVRHEVSLGAGFDLTGFVRPAGAFTCGFVQRRRHRVPLPPPRIPDIAGWIVGRVDTVQLVQEQILVSPLIPV